MINEPMPKGGAKELLQSRHGREYLAKLQDRHKEDLVQPSNPALFNKIYGDKLKATAQKMEENKQRARAEWAELNARKQHEQRKSG